MKFSSKRAMAAVASGAMLAMIGSGTAVAAPFIAFDFNYGVGSATNVGKINFSDPSLVVQSFTGGAPNGNFTDTGAFFLNTYNQVDNLALQTLFPSQNLTGLGAGALYIYYNLTGTATTSGSNTTLSFTPGGTIGLYYESSYNPATSSLKTGGGNVPTPDAGSTLLGDFALVDATAVGTFLTNALTVSSFQYDFKQTGGNSSLFQTYPGASDLFVGGVAKALEFGSADVQAGQVLFAPCVGAQGTGVSGTGIGPLVPPSAATGGTGVLCATPSAAGQFRLAAVPEPGTLALFGTGLLLLGFAAARRKIGQAA